MKSLLFLFSVALVVATGCSTPRGRAYLHSGESLVLAGQDKARLAFVPVAGKPVEIRSTYLKLPTTVRYELGRDYLIDNEGCVQRTANSRIPDFSTNILFGRENFQHEKFPGYGNTPFFAFADYYSSETIAWPAPTPETNAKFLKETRRKLREGKSVKIVVFGDSISTGCEATERRLVFWQRWADELASEYPRAKIEIVNGATGGDNTRNGLERLQEKVLGQKPDLVLIGFGMNDHNVRGVPVPEFAGNLGTIIDRIREKTGAEVLLYSTFPPNPKWAYGSHNMEAYAKATEQVAHEKSCAFADVYHYWQAAAPRKKPEDLLANNINHPNDFGHWIYWQALRAIGL